jgi:hypothetical protein
VNIVNDGKYQISTHQVANGSYILELQNNDGVMRKTIQIMR